MKSLLIKDCDWIVTQNPQRAILRNYSVYIENGVIRDITKKPHYEAEQVINGKGMALLPGLINTHTHLHMTLLRGYANDMKLGEWLEKRIWPIERKLTKKHCYFGALLGCLEMISTGTTCILDMGIHSKEVAKAVKHAGLRAFVGYEMIDRSLQPPQILDVEQFTEFIQEMRDPKIHAVISPYSLFTCSEELLFKAKELADRKHLPLQLHVAETRREQADFERKHGIREIEFLDKIGFLDENVIAVHCVWITKTEVKILAKRGVKVSHCPVSNMKMAEGGVAPIPEMLENGVVVSLGTDGAASNNSLDMFETVKFCALVHKAHRWDPTVLPAQKVLDLATIEGAHALGLADVLGSIEVGKQADLIIVNLNAPNLAPITGKETLISHLIYSAKGANVDTTIVDGEILKHGRKILTINPIETLEEVQKLTSELIL
ncbi:amidohydrolase [Candidatus Bathyarchaeota archaeon]|nr:amidohydrolase [Candidatus Bathyarchaeota archaeon]